MPTTATMSKLFRRPCHPIEYFEDVVDFETNPVFGWRRRKIAEIDHRGSVALRSR
jgi:hypothetical protein